MNKLVLLICIVFLTIGCENPFAVEDDNRSIDIYSELPMDNNGFYLFDYPDSLDNTYSNVKYNVNPAEIMRVGWASPDSFYVEYYNRIYSTSVVNYSTYSREDGSGQQIVYIYKEHIGDTLSIFGGLSEDVFDVIYIIID